ncbi:NADH dehydrogenase (ubiquinone) complex I, assembly factor 6 [Rhodotorula toruloides]|nr:NADH dehydrogenase (ubiquinone) complex I, assembly factor 6 [Rhodotorula toruloides]
MRASAVVRQATAPGSREAYDKALLYATDLVRRADHESIYASYFYPSSVRPAYLALRALNVELAGLPDQVSNQLVGRMRFQWWKDAIKGLYEGRPPPHPLLNLLSQLPQRPFLSSYHFTRLISTREANFMNPTFHSLQDLADYSAGTQASLLYLLLQATAAGSAPPASQGFSTGAGLRHTTPFQHTGAEHEHDAGAGQSGQAAKEADDLTLDHAASHLAVAITIATLLRSIPHHAAKRTNVIPLEVAARHNLREEALFRSGPEAEGLQDAVAQLAGIAEAELRTARECFEGTKGVPARAVPVFLSATPARSYLARLASPKIDYNPFDASLHKRYWKLPFQVWGDARNKRF